MALNFSFDFSKPVIKEFVVIDKQKNSFGSFNTEYSEYTFYELKVVPKIIYFKPFFQKELSENDYKSMLLKSAKIRSNNLVNLKGFDYELINTQSLFNIKTQKFIYIITLKEYVEPTIFKVNTGIYRKFNKGDKIDFEKHKGLFGIEWYYFR
ncbi:hypothetical protein OF897_07840 [Chryseobacterium formosus]|uniref:Uncharacterized protein n=1 Tax=Chryseobacterium formosus TaxID=1537363 RepID=A0ABT3XNX4_9FLAO|nr:hypothetical protein [Chryseobacterium formosus]MCX8523833.1 hypothetical protein [Chryseobacterium formosus]